MPRRSPGKASRNERRKISATLVNGISGAILVVGVVQPIFGATSRGSDWLRISLSTIGAFVIHIVALHIARGVED
jgi:uncharacterized membrane protein YeaQ/YmgE (transglycosylase-associated protein family)